MPQPAGQSHVHVDWLHVAAPLQPPQSDGQRYVHVVGSQMSLAPCAEPSQVVVLHWYEHVVVSQKNPDDGPGGCSPAGGVGHSYWHVAGLQTNSGPGDGPPQSAGHSQVHVATLHCRLPSHSPPQSGVHSKSQTLGFVLHTSPAGAGPEPQPVHSKAHDVVLHVENCDGAVAPEQLLHT